MTGHTDTDLNDGALAAAAADTGAAGTRPAARTAAAARDEEDAAVVIAVVTALAATAGAAHQEAPRSVWGSPAHRLGVARPGNHGWWTSGVTR